MRKVLVSFEVSAKQGMNSVFDSPNPDYTFKGEFDKDDDVSFSALCDLEYRVEKLVDALKSLGCRVIVIKKEISRLFEDKI